MKNIFSELKRKLTRRERKGKPVPVPVEPVEKPIKAVFMRPPLQQTPRAVWDEEARVYKGTNHLVQYQDVERRLADERRRLQRDRFGYRGPDQYEEAMAVAERSMIVPVEIFYEGSEIDSKG